MNLTDRTLIKTTLGVAVAVLVAVAGIAWNVAAMSTKVDAMWSAFIGPRIASNTTHKGEP